MANSNRADLLDDILSASSLEYLSDLKNESNRNEVANALAHVEQKQYSLHQWEVALTYILKRDMHLEKKEDLAVCFAELIRKES